MSIIKFQASIFAGKWREEDGKLIVPTIFTKEGVHNKGLKTFKELQKSAHNLNGRPIVLGHPKTLRPVKESDPIVGECRNVKARASDRSLFGDSVLDIELVNKYAPGTVDAIKAGTMREGSVGFLSQDEMVGGVFQGERYDHIETNILFDHYAIRIPRGACSVEDGCGLGFDEACTVEHPVEIEGVKYVKLEDMKNYVTDLLGRRIQEVLKDRVPSVLNDMSNPDVAEMARENERLKNQIESLTKERDGFKKTSEDLSTKITGLETSLTEATGKVKGFEDEKKQTVETQRRSLVKTLLELSNTDVTEDDVKKAAAEDYKDWAPSQLQKMIEMASKTTEVPAAPPAPADPRAFLPPGSIAGGVPASGVGDAFAPFSAAPEPMSIGNTLYGQPPVGGVAPGMPSVGGGRFDVPPPAGPAPTGKGRAK